MKSKTVDASKPKADLLKWGLVGLIIAAAVAANYYFILQPLPIRLAGWLLVLVAVILIGWQTATGKKVAGFIKEARIELRKVVWPTRQETFQTALIVLVIVAIMGLLLWGLDSILLWIIKWLAQLA